MSGHSGRREQALSVGTQGKGVTYCLENKDIVLAKVPAAKQNLSVVIVECMECLGKRFGLGKRWNLLSKPEQHFGKWGVEY